MAGPVRVIAESRAHITERSRVSRDSTSNHASFRSSGDTKRAGTQRGDSLRYRSTLHNMLFFVRFLCPIFFLAVDDHVRLLRPDSWNDFVARPSLRSFSLCLISRCMRDLSDNAHQDSTRCRNPNNAKLGTYNFKGLFLFCKFKKGNIVILLLRFKALYMVCKSTIL